MSSTVRVGVFLDADNLLPWWPSYQLLPDESRARLLQYDDFVRFALELERAVAPLGDIVVREAYGRWDNDARQHAAALLHFGAGFNLFHVPALSRTGLKNAGDILLSVRSILSTALGQQLDVVVVIAADSDYHPLVAELHGLGTSVISISFPLGEHQARLFDRVFDKRIELAPNATWLQLESETQAAEARKRAQERDEPPLIIRRAPSTKVLADRIGAEILPRLPEARGGVRGRLMKLVGAKQPRAERLLAILERDGVLDGDEEGVMDAGPVAADTLARRRSLLAWLVGEADLQQPGSPEPRVRRCFERFGNDDEAWLTQIVTPRMR